MKITQNPLNYLLAASIFILAACGSPAPAGQGIRGQVLLWPNCPVEQVDVPCPEKPYQTQLVVTDFEGLQVIKTFQSAADGTFEVTLPVGEYGIRSVVQGMPYCTTDQPIVVSAGVMTETVVLCDTGIR